MSVPTNVTRSTNVSDSGSIRSPTARSRPPATIQSKRWWSTTRSSTGRPSIARNRTSPTTNAAPDMRTPNHAPQRSLRRPASRRTAAPRSGSSTRNGAARNTSGTVSDTATTSVAAGSPLAAGRAGRSIVIGAGPSALEQVDVVDRGGPTGAEDGHDDREADDDLRRRDDHDEEREHLPGHVAVHAGERDEREVGRVGHELDAHEHDDRVAAQQHGRGADREEDRREHEVVGELHQSSPASVAPGVPPGTRDRPGSSGPETSPAGASPSGCSAVAACTVRSFASCARRAGSA